MLPATGGKSAVPHPHGQRLQTPRLTADGPVCGVDGVLCNIAIRLPIEGGAPLNRLQQQLISLVAAAALIGTVPASAAAFQVDGWYSGGGSRTTQTPPPVTPPPTTPPPVTPPPTQTPPPATGSTGGLTVDGWYAHSGGGTQPPTTPPVTPPPTTPPPVTPPPTTGSVSLTADEQALVNQTNQARAQAGLGPLTVDPVLTKLAREKA